MGNTVNSGMAANPNAQNNNNPPERPFYNRPDQNTFSNRSDVDQSVVSREKTDLSDFQAFPSSFLVNQPFIAHKRQTVPTQQSDFNVQPDETSNGIVPPPYEVIYNQTNTEQPPPYSAATNLPSAPPGNLFSQNSLHSDPMNSNTSTKNKMAPLSTRRELKTRVQRRKQNDYFEDEYSDDPSDYESDHNRRKMHQGYYDKYDYYDEDKDYIYYKTKDGSRYKHYRW